MMSSQEDLFATQEPKKAICSQEDPFATQQPKKKVKYNYVVLCDKDEMQLNPFSLFPTNMFSEKEISVRWLESILDDSSRLKSLQGLKGIGDKNLSLFGKVDEGIYLRFLYSFYIYLFFISRKLQLFTTLLSYGTFDL